MYVPCVSTSIRVVTTPDVPTCLPSATPTSTHHPSMPMPPIVPASSPPIFFDESSEER